MRVLLKHIPDSVAAGCHYLFAAIATVWLCAVMAFGQTPTQIQVRLFSGIALSSQQLRIQAKGARYFLDGSAVQLSESAEVRFEDGLRVTAAGVPHHSSELRITPAFGETTKLTLSSGAHREVQGVIEIQRGRKGWEITNHAPLETYVASVVKSETVGDEPAYLQAMAVAIRTKALAESRKHPLTDRSGTMIYTGSSSPAALAASKVTKGRVLTYNGALCPIFFHACCGGATVPVEQGIVNARPHPALCGVSDLDAAGRPWCRNADHFHWRREMEINAFNQQIVDYLKARALGEPSYPVSFEKATLDAPFEVFGAEEKIEVDPVDFRMYLGRAAGWNFILCQRFKIERSGRNFIFKGRGFGHRVGLCQAGARARAQQGAGMEEILQAYFPGARLSGYLR